jgi:hypothetical protein
MNSEEWAKIQLEGLGFTVQKLAKSREQSPDFLASTGTERILIELKTKFTDAETLSNHRHVLDSAGIVSVPMPLKRENTISGIIRDAVDQLTSYPSDFADFRLVWLHSKGECPDLQFDQFEIALYGCLDVVDISALPNASPYPCYYFLFNDFYLHRACLDGAIISTAKNGKLCLNDKSPRYTKLKASHLAEAMNECINDPLQEEEQKRAFLADCGSEVDRRDRLSVLKYVQRKYGKPYLTCLDGHHLHNIASIPIK